MKSKALLILLVFVLVLVGSSPARAEGAQFFDLWFDLIFIPDLDDDLCMSMLIPPDFGNSFARVNPNGTITVYYAGHPASIVFITAGGDVYTGVGQSTANGCADGCSWATFHITGRVTNEDGETKQAVCNGTFNARGDLVQIDASLH